MAALAVAFFAPSPARAADAANTSAPREGDLKRAEKIVARLRLIEAAAAQKPGDYAAAVENLYPALLSDVSSLRAGDLKADLTTAVLLHDAAYRASRAVPARTPDCDAEAREIYLRLCRENVGGTVAELLRAKARLHTRWAEAAAGYARGRRDAATLDAMAEMRGERLTDAALASRAVAALRNLQANVNAYPSLAEFEEGREVAKVSYEQFSADTSAALREVERLLAALPRGPVRQLLTNARSSYRDGLFWWGKTRARNAPTVSAVALAEGDPLEEARLDPTAAGYAVVINWRHALQYTARAEDLIRSNAVQTVSLRLGR